MSVEKIDSEAQEMLRYLNSNNGLTSATLAEAFNQKYHATLNAAMKVLTYLDSKSLIKIKTDEEKSAIFIQLTHQGLTYEKDLSGQEKEARKKLWSDRRWNIVTLLLSAAISVIINIFMK